MRSERFITFAVQRSPYEAQLDQTLSPSERAASKAQEYFMVNVGDRNNFPSFKDEAFRIQQGTVNTIFVSDGDEAC